MRKMFFILVCSILMLAPLKGISHSDPGPEGGDMEKGVAEFNAENYEEAVSYFQKARESDPLSSRAAYFLGVAYKKTQDYAGAKAHLKDAVSLQPAVREAVIELADTLYQLGETEEALTSLEIAEKEGIAPARTSFLKGLVLLKLGKGEEAIESFRNAKSLDDRLSTSADYQIGLANLQSGRLNEARDIFREIVVKDPNSDISQFASQYIDAITRRIKEERPFRASIGVQYQYDDNVLLKPGDSAAAAGITDEADSSVVYALRGEYVPKLKGRYGFKAQYSLYINDRQDLDTHDVQSHTVSIAPSYNMGRGSLSLLAGYNYTLVHDEKYLQTITVSPTYAFTINGNQFAQAFLRYQQKDYLQSPLTPEEDRDGNDYGAGAAWFYLIAENKGFISLRYEFNKEDTEGENWYYMGNKAGVSLLHPLTDKLNFNVGGEAYFQDFENTHTVFLEKRKDRTYTANAMLSYNVYDGIDIQVQYSYIRGQSNIAVYDYEKNVVTAGVEARF